MGERSEYFVKGGFGCLGLFLALGLLALAVGGTFYMDFGGAVILFVVGGLLGLVYLATLKRGRRQAGGD